MNLLSSSRKTTANAVICSVVPACLIERPTILSVRNVFWAFASIGISMGPPIVGRDYSFAFNSDSLTGGCMTNLFSQTSCNPTTPRFGDNMHNSYRGLSCMTRRALCLKNSWIRLKKIPYTEDILGKWSSWIEETNYFPLNDNKTRRAPLSGQGQLKMWGRRLTGSRRMRVFDRKAISPCRSNIINTSRK